MYHHLKKGQKEAVPRCRNYFYHGCFLQYFECCPRIPSFHLNNVDNEVGPMNCSLDVIPTTVNWMKSMLKIVPNLVLTKVTKAQP